MWSPFRERVEDPGAWDHGRPLGWMAAWRGGREYDRAFDAWVGPMAPDPEAEWYRGLSASARFTHDWFGHPRFPGAR
jgi:hypothetical protein